MSVGQLGLFASAVAGRPVAVAAGEAGHPTWTDGVTIYVDGDADAATRVQALAVQASLLAAGSLDPDVLRRLARRQSLVARYLSVEGGRALAVNRHVLPASLRFLTADGVSSESPAMSLVIAESKTALGDPPPQYGTIHVRALLAAQRAAEKSAAAAASRHRPRRETETVELDGGAETDNGEPDLFSSPVGGGGVIGKLLARMLSQVRQLGGGGPPGADAATHQRRSASRSTGAVATSLRPSNDSGPLDTVQPGEFRYPEWDCRRTRYRPDWCTVRETDADELGEGVALPDGHAMRRALTRLGVGLSRHRRQAQGDDIDVDAAVELRVELSSASAPDDRVYVDNLRQRRDLSVLVLLDVSGSAAESAGAGHTVHELQRSATATVMTALHQLGDRVALYAYNSQGRSAVRLTPVKRFDERFDTGALRRLYGLKPSAYSRLGAAIRHGTTILRDDGGTPRRLLVVISDGLAYDHGYERAYGAADARRALLEVGRQGVGCVCLTVGAGTDVGELRRVFGTAAHATVARPDQLAGVIGPLFAVALRRAELRRRAGAGHPSR